MLKLGYLGPEGTFSHQAAMIWEQSHGNGGFKLIPFRPITAVLEALKDREIDRAIVPLENLLEDAVSETVDFLISNAGAMPLYITGELLLPIRQMLLGKQGTDLDQVKIVVSHGQGLRQCKRLIEKHGWQTIEAVSTATAAQKVAESDDFTMVAIASPQAAEINKLEVLQADVGDSGDNVTRFVFLGGPKPSPTGDDKTTIFFITKDQPGALYQALGVFFYQDVNLSKIASRTTKISMGEYIFWIDAQGHQKDPALQIAIEQLEKRFAKKVIVVGSYPKARIPERRQ